jgi:hypothetical protein
MNISSPVHLGAVLFDGFELLDLFGPLEMFGLLEGTAKITEYFTASGISAGMDMALAVIASFSGRETSLQIAARAEYEWHKDSSRDPFAAVAGL